MNKYHVLEFNTSYMIYIKIYNEIKYEGRPKNSYAYHDEHKMF